MVILVRPWDKVSKAFCAARSVSVSELDPVGAMVYPCRGWSARRLEVVTPLLVQAAGDEG